MDQVRGAPSGSPAVTRENPAWPDSRGADSGTQQRSGAAVNAGQPGEEMPQAIRWSSLSPLTLLVSMKHK